jgi:serine phosphatase RsbU (regulator of sigma subunit)
LQRSFLPEALPTVAGVDVAARYQPGGPGVDVGGDWYDFLDLPDGSLLLVMGDVVGKGVLAASLMGQLRNALRAFAFEGYPPAIICTKLNNLLCERAETNAMATLVVARYEPGSGVLHIVRAGHLPPLVIEPDGRTRFCELGGGLPLGTLAATTYEEGTTELVPGSTILLYTDGLVESRRTSLEDGLQLLKNAASAPIDLERLCDHVLEVSLGAAPAEDDVALLFMRVDPLRAPIDLSISAAQGGSGQVRGSAPPI